MPTNTQMLHSIMDKLDSIDTRLSAVEAKGESHAFIKPQVVKNEASKGSKTKPEAEVQSSESKAHHAMKAKLKAMPKKVQKRFTDCWLALRQDAGYGLKGSLPKPVYFELQMQAFKEVA